MPQAPQKKRRWVALMLAWRDLRHERLLSGCMIFALVGVLTPLMIVMGLKNGYIQYLRNGLTSNPAYRSIDPEEAVTLPETMLAELRADPSVSYVTLTPAKGDLAVWTTHARKGDRAALMVTSPGDPLIDDNALPSPQPGEAVISHALMTALDLEVGDAFTMIVRRQMNREEQSASETLRVSAILPEGADWGNRIYAPFALSRDVDAYRQGLTVAERGWGGEINAPYHSYDGAILFSWTPLDERTQFEATYETGFRSAQTLDAAAVADRLGAAFEGGAAALDLTASGAMARRPHLAEVENVVGDRILALTPYTDPVPAVLSREEGGGDSFDLAIKGLSIDPAFASSLGLDAPPWVRPGAAAEFSEIAQILLPQGHPLLGARRISARVDLPTGAVQVPLTVAGETPHPWALAPVALTAMLRSGQEIPIYYDDAAAALRRVPPKSLGFRLYAKSIDHTIALAERMTEAGIKVRANTFQIKEMNRLEAQLSNLVSILLWVGLVGAGAALTASLYASVERKQSELGLMRLIGLRPREVAAFPMHQALMLGFAGFGTALAVYWGGQTFINATFAEDLGGASAVSLSLEMVFTLLAAVLILTTFAGFMAALRTMGLEPSEVLRVE